MRVIGVDVLYEYMERHAEVRKPLKSWIQEVKDADWKSWSDLKDRYPRADHVAKVDAGHRVVFDIKGNKYRLAVLVYFSQGMVIVEKIGTHAEYDNWQL